jgi:RHS repeat-associated protein
VKATVARSGTNYGRFTAKAVAEKITKSASFHDASRGAFARRASTSGGLFSLRLRRRIAGTVLGIANPHYSYDADGNMLCEYVGTGCVLSGREIDAWTPFNKVKSITQGATAVALTYDSEHARLTQTVTQGSAVTATTYLNDPMSGAMAEQVVSGGVTTWHDYLMADGKIVAEHFQTGASQSWSYFLLDHLGSVSVVTGSGGTVASWQSYDAWGRMRNADGSDDTTCALPASSPSTRGYTSQEEIPAVCLLNYNARIYDPTLGRFLSPDPVTQFPFNMQGLNRYSYVYNDPLSLTDPSGYLAGVDETVVVTALADPITAPLAIVAAAAEIIADVIGLGGIFGAAPVTGGIVTTSPTPTPATNAGNPSGLTTPQNTALPSATNVSNIVPTSDVCASSSATQTAAANYAGAVQATDATQITETVVVTGQRIPFMAVGDIVKGASTVAVSLNSMLSNYQYSHYYQYHPQVCSYSDEACTTKNVWDGLKHDAFPGQDSSTVVQSGQHYQVADLGQNGSIRVVVDDETMTITNYTDPTHIFCCGSVTMNIAAEQDGIYLDVVGTGTNTNFATWAANYAGGLGFPYDIAPRLSYLVDYSFFQQTGVWPLGSVFMPANAAIPPMGAHW